jgi:kanamycin kinase
MTINLNDYPTEFHPLLSGAKLYDRSYSLGARVIFIDKDGGYFLKSAPQGSLEREAAVTRYFHGKGLSAAVLSYVSGERDWMLTERIPGDNCTAAKYLEQPERLCDMTAELLAALHAEDYSGCPVQNHTERYLAGARKNYLADTFDKTNYPDKDGADTMLKEYCKDYGYASAGEAWAVVEKHSHQLKSDTLLHGDYCLPNIILDDWRFSGFIDLDNAGVGDRHVDVFWGIWSLRYNLKTDKYRERFIDGYGRGIIYEYMLRIVAACEVFG